MKVLTKIVFLSSDTNNETGNSLKLLNGYMLWLNQFYNGRDVTPEKVSKKLLHPLCKLINRIDFEEMTNVWCTSKLLFELIKRKYWSSDLTIRKACSDFPPKIGDIVYKSSSLKLYATSMNRNGSSTESVSDAYSSDSDYPGVSQHTVKTVHAEFCRVETRIGYTNEEMETYSCILGLNTEVIDDDGPAHGWIINSQWKDVCSESKD